MNKYNAIGIDFILATGVLMVVGFFGEKSIFEAPFGHIMIVFGMMWFASNILTAWLKPFEQTIGTGVISALIMVIGATSSPDIDHSTPPQNVMGNTPEAEWQFIITYKKYDLKHTTTYSFKGDSVNADKSLEETILKWMIENKNDKDIDFVGAEKILCFIPKDFAKKNKYAPDLSKKY